MTITPRWGVFPYDRRQSGIVHLLMDNELFYSEQEATTRARDYNDRLGFSHVRRYVVRPLNRHGLPKVSA